jgi:hypothetical protein
MWALHGTQHAPPEIAVVPPTRSVFSNSPTDAPYHIGLTIPDLGATMEQYTAPRRAGGYGPAASAVVTDEAFR